MEKFYYMHRSELQGIYCCLPPSLRVSFLSSCSVWCPEWCPMICRYEWKILLHATFRYVNNPKMFAFEALFFYINFHKINEIKIFLLNTSLIWCHSPFPINHEINLLFHGTVTLLNRGNKLRRTSVIIKVSKEIIMKYVRKIWIYSAFRCVLQNKSQLLCWLICNNFYCLI